MNMCYLRDEKTGRVYLVEEIRIVNRGEFFEEAFEGGG
jgi:hypothetical protein